MRDFWLSCGHHLTDRDADGRLLVTDEFLKVYLARPELRPPTDACAAECGLHAKLLCDPRRDVGTAEIAAIVDADARENWSLLIAFRDRLLKHRTLEAAYLDLVRSGSPHTPPIFLNQLVHIILRNMLDACDDTLVLRAAELLFRPQRMTSNHNHLVAADEEVIGELMASTSSPLASMFGMAGSGEIDVLTNENVDYYWERSDLFNMALDLTAGHVGLEALGRVLSRWVEHMLAVDVDVEPLVELSDVDFVWYVGFDVEGTRIGTRLWNGEDIDEETRSRIVGLFRLTFRDAQAILNEVKDEAVYLILAMTPDRVLRVKPQNLLTGLPLLRLEAAS